MPHFLNGPGPRRAPALPPRIARRVPQRDRGRFSMSMIASVRGAKVPCERCEELELWHLNRTEEYIGLVERQSRMFRNRDAQAGRDLDAPITQAKAARTKALRELDEH